MESNIPSLDQEKKEELLEFKGSIFKKYGINHPLLEYRTPFEKSVYSCVENILRDTLKSFGMVVGAKVALAILGLLLKLKKVFKDPSMIIKAIFDSGHLKLASFTGSLTFLMKSMITIMRILREKDDGWNGFAGGLVGGFFSMYFLKSKKIFLATFMLARACECIYNSYADKGHYKRNNIHWVLVYSIFMTAIGYTYAYERYLTDPGAMKSFDFVTNQNKSEWVLLWIYHEMTRRRLAGGDYHRDPFLIGDSK